MRTVSFHPYANVNASRRARRAGRPKSLRRGFTLIELLLVFSLLLMVTAVAWPSVRRMVQRHQLQQAAFVAQTRLSSARLNAIRQGAAYEFRYEPGGRMYLVMPVEHEPAIAALIANDRPSPLDAEVSWGELAEGMYFAARAHGSLAGSRLNESQLRRVPGAWALQNIQWSPPVRFFPNGSATESEFSVVDSTNRAIRVSVHRLTGAVSTSSQPITP